MGLSLHIHTHAAASLDIDEIGKRVASWHAMAQSFAADGWVDHVCEPSNAAEDLAQFATNWLSAPHPTEPDTTVGIAVRPLDGWIFLVQLGAGCEPFVLGLCRYPVAVNNPSGGKPLATGRNDAWHLLSSGKTQYASIHGWEHFRRCHIAAVELAAAAQTLGVEVRIEDEGGYWPDRNEVVLRASLDRLNRSVAGLAGALKDAADAEAAATNDTADADQTSSTPVRSIRSGSVESPIFEHPHFERLEAEAESSADAQKISAALRAIKRESP